MLPVLSVDDAPAEEKKRLPPATECFRSGPVRRDSVEAFPPLRPRVQKTVCPGSPMLFTRLSLASPCADLCPARAPASPCHIIANENVSRPALQDCAEPPPRSTCRYTLAQMWTYTEKVDTPCPESVRYCTYRTAVEPSDASSDVSPAVCLPSIGVAHGALRRGPYTNRQPMHDRPHQPA